MASVAVYREGKFSHFLKFAKALKKEASGRWRFRDKERTELEEVAAEPRMPKCRIFVDPPPSTKFDWRPRPSGMQRIKVWQAQASRAQ